jgi:hypothetical protein
VECESDGFWDSQPQLSCPESLRSFGPRPLDHVIATLLDLLALALVHLFWCEVVQSRVHVLSVVPLD